MNFIKDLKVLKLICSLDGINLDPDPKTGKYKKEYHGNIVYMINDENEQPTLCHYFTQDGYGHGYIPSELVSKLEKLWRDFKIK